MNSEHVDVVIVGAGLSGIGAARYLQDKCPWATFAIIESRDSIGGTWDLFRYPGIRSDSDMYTLGYSFRPWDREESIAEGASILQYIKETATEGHLDKYIQFNTRITAAAWSSVDARWTLTAEHTDRAETSQLTCNFVFSCTGYYRYDQGYQPDFPGQELFKGPIIHPQAWPEDLDYAGKKVVVIGSGATAVTLIPSLATTAAHVVMLQRSPSYIVAVLANNPLTSTLRKLLPSPLSGKVIRWCMALLTQATYQFCQRWPDVAKGWLRKGVEHQLPAGYDIETHFTPTYNPWDQRLCVVPDGDLFKAIKSGRASVVTDHIASFSQSGIELESGGHLDADIIITATGIEMLFAGGMALTVDGEPVDLANRLIYKGMMIENVPNFAIAVGYTNASWTLKCDLTCDYVCRLLNHLRDQGQRQCTPRNFDASITAEPLIGLSSGYVQRSKDKFPKQGSKFPWRVHQSYLADFRALKLGAVDGDRAMVFSAPMPVRSSATD